MSNNQKGQAGSASVPPSRYATFNPPGAMQHQNSQIKIAENFHLQANQYGLGSSQQSNPGQIRGGMQSGPAPSTTQDYKYLYPPIQSMPMMAGGYQFTMPPYYATGRNANVISSTMCPIPAQQIPAPNTFYGQPQPQQVFAPVVYASNPLLMQRMGNTQPMQQIQVPPGPPGQQPSHQVLPGAVSMNTASQTRKKPRTNAIPIVNPATGENVMTDEDTTTSSVADSQDSSARQTPQSSATRAADASVVADFERRVAEVAARDSPPATTNMTERVESQGLTGAIEPQLTPQGSSLMPSKHVLHAHSPAYQPTGAAQLPMPDTINSYDSSLVPQSQHAPPPPTHINAAPPASMIIHSAIQPTPIIAPGPIHMVPAASDKLVKRNDLAAESKLQATTKDFKSELSMINTPVVSAMAEGNEVTITSTSSNNKLNKDRDSPSKRKQRPQAGSAAQTPAVVAPQKQVPAVDYSQAAAASNKDKQNQQAQVPQQQQPQQANVTKQKTEIVQVQQKQSVAETVKSAPIQPPAPQPERSEVVPTPAASVQKETTPKAKDVTPETTSQKPSEAPVSQPQGKSKSQKVKQNQQSSQPQQQQQPNSVVTPAAAVSETSSGNTKTKNVQPTPKTGKENKTQPPPAVTTQQPPAPTPTPVVVNNQKPTSGEKPAESKASKKMRDNANRKYAATQLVQETNNNINTTKDTTNGKATENNNGDGRDIVAIENTKNNNKTQLTTTNNNASSSKTKGDTVQPKPAKTPNDSAIAATTTTVPAVNASAPGRLSKSFVPSQQQAVDSICSIVKAPPPAKNVPKPAANPPPAAKPETVAPPAPVPVSTPVDDKQLELVNEAVKAIVSISDMFMQAYHPIVDGPEAHWTPFHLDRPRKYPRKYLINLNDDPKSKLSPPDIGSIMNELIRQDLSTTDRLNLRFSEPVRNITHMSMGGGGQRHDFAPPYASKSQSQRIMPNRKSQQGNKPMMSKDKPKQMIHLSLSLKEDVKLNSTENAWKPMRKNENTQSSENVKSTEELYRKFRSVLNKLTPQNFQTLLSKVKELKAETTEQMQGLIDLVFEKAIDEPNFAAWYSRLCREIALTSVSEGKDVIHFRMLLISRCQREFEKENASEEERKLKMEEIKKETDPEKTKLLELELEESLRLARRRSVGNVKFIGELFKLQMLTVKITKECLKSLLKKGTEDDLECLCKLLTTIGMDLENKTDHFLDDFMAELKDTVEKKKNTISSRVRFMIQDVIDLRKNKWIPRRQDNLPQKLDEIKAQEDLEQFNELVRASIPSTNTSRKDDAPRGGSLIMDRKRNNNRSDNNGPDNSGWTTATTRNSRQQQINVDVGRFKVLNNSTTLILGSHKKFAEWAGGASSTTTTTSNKYGVLDNSSDASDRSKPFDKSSGDRSVYNSKGSSMEKRWGKNTDNGGGSRSGSQHRSRENSQARPSNRQMYMGGSQSLNYQPTKPTSLPSVAQVTPPAAPAPVVTPVSKPKATLIAKDMPALEIEDLQEKTRAIVKLLMDSTLDDAMEEFVELIPRSNYSDFVTSVVEIGLERSAKIREMISKLFVGLCKNALISPQVYCDGLGAVLQFVEDLLVDIPKLIDYIPDLITPLLAEGVVSIKMLVDSPIKAIEDSGNKKFGLQAQVIGGILKQLAEIKNPVWTKAQWDASGLNLADLVVNGDLNEFIAQFNLGFMTSPSSDRAVDSSASALSMNDIYNKLTEFFVSETPREEVESWIEHNIPKASLKSNEFIRALMTAVCETSIETSKSQKKQVSEKSLSSKFVYLQKYVDNQDNLELQAMFALQALLNKLEHPQGLLLGFCNKLWEEDIITTESFLEWAKNMDPIEGEGKGVALKSLAQFLTSLTEGGEDTENDEADVPTK